MEVSPTLLQDTSMSPPKEAEHSSPSFSSSARHTKRRSKSFCGSPSSSSSSSLGSFSSSNFSNLDSPLSPVTPLRYSGGIPFKWEQQPGIPKQQHYSPKYKTPGRDLLPLPPAGASPSQRFISLWPKKKTQFQRDPFVAALVECSKPEEEEEEEEECWKRSGASVKVGRTLSDRFGFVDLYGSCKTSCSVMESKVLIPRSARSSYDMLSRRIG
ncbi:hypothetical protein H6P81_015521 [Aristolochia fimbriata]|uniref:Uncharacterized protein n=1 Tax=Aristolochia fimbriata TaxID=158543 RepID=A0AAV7E8P8_ARIFI|nr:hypothetical protein H6P81_015521 [Aristolochia fimbriata]